MKTVNYVSVCAVFIAVLSVNVHGAFLVEAVEGGLANENYDGAGNISVLYPLGSTAPGCLADNGVFGSLTEPHVYIFSYTPSPAGYLDVDNTVYAAGTDLGNGNLATGLTGGGAGFYNVYATWCSSTNVDPSGCYFTTTSEGTDIVTGTVNQNAPSEGTNKWMLLAEGVPFITGTTYTITQTANSVAHVSMRSHGVMWEFVEPIEPVADIVVDGGELNLEEGGPSGQYTIALKEQPLTMIIVTAQVCEPNQLTLNGEKVLEMEFAFTPDDWDVARTVNVAAIEDGLVEPETPMWIVHMTDPNEVDLDPNSIWNDGYGGLATVYILGDIPGMRITESDGTTEVIEGSPTSDTYDVKLTYPPTDNVTVTIATDGEVLADTGSGPGTTAELVFTPGNWQDNQTVTVTAVDDDVLEYTHLSQITHVAASLDSGYNGLEGPNTVVSVDDNECGVWGYFELDFDQDCVVALNDFVELAIVWMECTQPYDINCTDLR